MSAQSSCGCPMNTFGGVDHLPWCSMNPSRNSNAATIVSLPSNPPNIATISPTWLSCPECGTTQVTRLSGKEAVCSLGHSYPVPAGPIAFWFMNTVPA